MCHNKKLRAIQDPKTNCQLYINNSNLVIWSCNRLTSEMLKASKAKIKNKCITQHNFNRIMKQIQENKLFGHFIPDIQIMCETYFPQQPVFFRFCDAMTHFCSMCLSWKQPHPKKTKQTGNTRCST